LVVGKTFLLRRSLFLLLLGGGLIGALVLFTRATLAAIARNGGGICAGYSPSSPPGEPPLTTWLDHLLNDIAGKSRGHPLTFGDLRKHQIELAM